MDQNPITELFKIENGGVEECLGETSKYRKMGPKKIAPVRKAFKKGVGLFSLQKRCLHSDLMTIFE